MNGCDRSFVELKDTASRMAVTVTAVFLFYRCRERERTTSLRIYDPSINSRLQPRFDRTIEDETRQLISTICQNFHVQS